MRLAALYAFIAVSTAFPAISGAEFKTVTAKDFDLACAVTSGAEIGTRPKDTPEMSMALTVWTFYLGRLGGRDDKIMWSPVIKGRVAELQVQAKSPAFFTQCVNFYLRKIAE